MGSEFQREFAGVPSSCPKRLNEEPRMPVGALREPSDVARHLLRVEAAATPRQARLFACGCARLAWDLLDAPAARRAVVTAEEFSDGRVTVGEFRAAAAAARWVRKTAPPS